MKTLVSRASPVILAAFFAASCYSVDTAPRTDSGTAGRDAGTGADRAGGADAVHDSGPADSGAQAQEGGGDDADDTPETGGSDDGGVEPEGDAGADMDTDAGGCVSGCSSPGERSCSADGLTVMECINAGTPQEPCLVQTPVKACGPAEKCEAGACKGTAAGCCSAEGSGCCQGSHGSDCCGEAETCEAGAAIRNGSEACDDSGVDVDPAAYRYFLLCLNGNGGTAYVSTNSGGPCPDGVRRCQCWEDDGTRPWEVIDYVAELVCDRAGKRAEVFFPSGGGYYSGVHPVPGDYDPRGYCPSGPGCMTCTVLIRTPR